MRLTIRLFAVLRERAGRDEIALEDVPVGATVDEVKALLSTSCPELGDLSAVAGVIGTTYARGDSVVAEGDEVAFLPPVSGGAGHAVEPSDLEAGVFELASEPLDVAEIQRRVGHPSCGAIVLFTGVTRDTNRGQAVVELDYEAFAEMAGPEMGRIFADCLAAHGPASAGQGKDRAADQGQADGEGAGSLPPEALALRMLAIHRTGVVPVGEPSVAIAVASPHRDAAFQAARFLIDTLKERLPVWKKEVYRDGHHWIGDRS
ncbi:MAG: molybdenum cofactor biosynthesis protein MoaE [Planctomycetota bacterium]